MPLTNLVLYVTDRVFSTSINGPFLVLVHAKHGGLELLWKNKVP